MTRGRSGLLGAALACTLLLAGCGGSDEPRAESSAMALDPPSPVAVDPATFVREVLAAVDTRETVHLEIAGSFLEASADVAYGTPEPASRITASVYGGQQVIIAVGGTVYLQTSPGSDFSVVDASTPVLGPLVGTLSSLGPRDAVEGIEPAVTSITEVGTAQADDVAVTEYEVVVDTARLDGALKLLAGTSGASEQLEMRFFLDADGLPSKITFPVSGEQVEVTFSDWDAPVVVKAPR